MRWADLGDHCQERQGMKWFNLLQQEKRKKKSWLTDSQPSLNMSLRCVWLAVVAWVHMALRSACLKSSGESEVDFAISCWCARALHYIIHMLHNTLAAWHTHTHTYQIQTHIDTHAWGETGSRTSLLQMFLLRQFPRLLQSISCFSVSCIMCLHMIVHYV